MPGARTAEATGPNAIVMNAPSRREVPTVLTGFPRATRVRAYCIHTLPIDKATGETMRVVHGVRRVAPAVAPTGIVTMTLASSDRVRSALAARPSAKGG